MRSLNLMNRASPLEPDGLRGSSTVSRISVRNKAPWSDKSGRACHRSRSGHARQVQDQIRARSLSSDVLLQVGVQRVVFAIQLRRQTDEDGLPFERGQPEASSEARQSEKDAAFDAGIDRGFDRLFEPGQSILDVAGRGGASLIGLSMPKQLIEFLVRDEYAPGRGQALGHLPAAIQGASAQLDQQVQLAQLIAQMSRIVLVGQT